MKWAEFKSMPDDLKIAYIKAIREKYNAPDTYIGQMLGGSQTKVSKEIRRLGIGNGKTRSGRTHWNKAGFLAWISGVPVPTTDTVEVPKTETPEPEQHEEPVSAAVVEAKTGSAEKPKAIPKAGSMTFDGTAEAILNTIRDLLGGENVHISITWCELE